jgi:uncharacterized protein (DUF58 family)
VDLSPALRQRLGRIKLLAPHALASGGVGERRSGRRGEGIEFEQHRPFETGDDARRIDPYLYARFGAPYVREYNVGQQLTVTILLDASRSMAAGTPAKVDVARSLATGLAAIALAGADAVQSGVWRDDRLAWHPRVSGTARLGDLERWWATHRAGGASDLLGAVRRVRDDLPRRGLTVLVSDMWSDAIEATFEALASAEQSILAIQLLSPEEVDPTRHGLDAMRMIDAETGDEIDVALGAIQVARYGTLLAAWTDTLRRRALAARGTFVRVTSDQRAEDVFFRTLPAAGVLR